MNNGLASTYHDFAGLAELKHQVREDRAGSSEQVAKQFESLFVRMMVKQMRQAGFGDGILDSDRTRFYQDMYDQQLSLHLTQQGGMGLGNLLRRQIGSGEATSEIALGGLDPYWRNPVSSAMRAFTPAVSPTEERITENAASSHSASELAGAMFTRETRGATEVDSPQAFVQRLWPSAEAAAAELGLPAEALLAQAALETGWGNHVMAAADGRSSHNLFGIKADQRWQGGQVKRETLEFEAGVAVRKRERFRTYDSYEQSFQDYVALLQSSPRYAEALSNADDPDSYFRALQDAGYATDPAYAEKILRVMQGPEMQSALATFKAAT